MSSTSTVETDYLAFMEGEKYTNLQDKGVYACSSCSSPLYSSDDKLATKDFPTFSKPLNPGLVTISEAVHHGHLRRELKCKCGAYIGVVTGSPARERHQLYSICLKFSQLSEESPDKSKTEAKTSRPSKISTSSKMSWVALGLAVTGICIGGYLIYKLSKEQPPKRLQ